jgi:adenylosuccinate synthase
VGAGPFPTKVTGEVEELLRKNGNEYGTTTGRPRDCGWVDLVALQHAVRANGITNLAITKLDVLSDLDDIQICIGYDEDDEDVQMDFPVTSRELELVEPILLTPVKGWKEDISTCRTWAELPPAAQSYVKLIWEGCGMPPVSHIGVGQDREEVIELDNVWE